MVTAPRRGPFPPGVRRGVRPGRLTRGCARPLLLSFGGSPLGARGSPGERRFALPGAACCPVSIGLHPYDFLWWRSTSVDARGEAGGRGVERFGCVQTTAGRRATTTLGNLSQDDRLLSQRPTGVSRGRVFALRLLCCALILISFQNMLNLPPVPLSDISPKDVFFLYVVVVVDCMRSSSNRIHFTLRGAVR